jgi:zinc protease
VKKLVAKWFGPLPRGPAPPPVRTDSPVLAEGRRETLTDEVQLARVIFGYVGPKPTESEALQLAMRILGNGKSSRLYQALVHEQRIAQDVGASTTPAQLGGITEISATVQAGRDPAEVERALSEQIRALQAAPPTRQELLRARRAVLAETYSALENPGGSGGRADVLSYFEMWRRDPGWLPAQLERYDAVTAEQVREAAAHWLSDDRRVVLHVLPSAGAK